MDPTRREFVKSGVLGTAGVAASASSGSADVMEVPPPEFEADVELL